MFGAASRGRNSRTVYTNAPVGLIVPYNGHPESLPPEWELVTTAALNDKFIVGAGSTYAVGSSGNDAYTGSATTNTLGDHTGTAADWTTQASNGLTGLNVAGSHSHTLTISNATDPLNKSYGLIRCVTSAPIPAGAMLLGNQTLTGLSAQETGFTDRRLFRAVASYASAGVEGGSNTRTFTIADTSAGGHSHGALNAYYSTTGAALYNAALSTDGSHGHAYSPAGIADNTRRFVLSMWSNASRRFSIPANAIAMWETATAPAGWKLCDGTLSTPDMRNRYLAIGNTSIHNTSAGANTYTVVTGASSSAGAHDHSLVLRSLAAGETPNVGYHADSVNAHTHTSQSISTTETVRYYALTFIMKT